MIRTRILFFAGFSALTIIGARQAQADVYYVTYTGTASGTDTNGVFGTAGALLSGAAFTSTYTYDPSKFGNAVYPVLSDFTQVYGGDTYGGTTDPILSATITINGHSFAQGAAGGGGDGRVTTDQTLSGTTGPYMQEHVYGSTGDLFDAGFINGLPVVSLTAIQSFDFLSSQALPGQIAGGLNFDGEHITLHDAHVSVTDSPPAPVPEPASFALLAGAAGVFAMALGTSRVMSRSSV